MRARFLALTSLALLPLGCGSSKGGAGPAADAGAGGQDASVQDTSFPTDVGKWVDELARAALNQRGAVLAEIESSSGVGPGPVQPRASDFGMADDTIPPDNEPSVLAPEPSSLSLETPKPSIVRGLRSRNDA